MEAAAKGVALESELRFKDINGNYRWHLNIASPVLNEDGEITMWVGSTTDIQRIKEEEQRKTDFIGMVSHELKTPITSLYAYLQILQAKSGKSTDPFVQRSLDQSLKQVRKMNTMINGFLNVARLESGKIAIDKTVFDVQELFAEVEAEMSPVNTTHPIVFICATAAPVMADRDKIGQVLHNLISNAVKYSNIGSSIQVVCTTDQYQVTVAITDQGMGIQPEALKHVFERYYRAETHKSIAGFGIGLYLCAEIIKRHDGKIWAESEAGKGSTFYFSLPLQGSLD
jgi:two-component system CheB/CheR fusion protein